jgi:dephospho-CoA kinase
VEAIKLLEGPLVDHVHTVWVVTAPRATRIARLVGERGLSREEAARRVDAQNPEEMKVRRADVVLANDSSVADLERQLDVAWNQVQAALQSTP